jgi:PAS domain S-box-containing protein
MAFTTGYGGSLLGKILCAVHVPGAALCLVVGIVLACALMAGAIPAAEAPSMPPEPPAAEPQEPITPVPFSSEERFRVITESANDAIISADGSRSIVSWNARAEAIFGYTAAEILGAPLTRLILARGQADHAQRLTLWSATGAAHLIGTITEFSGVRKDGREFPLACRNRRPLASTIWCPPQRPLSPGAVPRNRHSTKP